MYRGKWWRQRFPFNWSDIIFGRTASGSAEKTVTAPRSLFASLSLNRRCKKSPLSLRPRASQRIVISFYPQAASLSLGWEPAKCECTKAQKHKVGPTLAKCAQILPPPALSPQYHTFAQRWSTMQNASSSKSDSQLCQICQACELHKNVLNFSLLGTQRRDTTALEEAFEFKARYKGGVWIKCQCYGWSKEGVGYIIIGTAGRSCTEAWCTLAQSTKSWVARDIGGKTCELRKSQSLRQQQQQQQQHCHFTAALWIVPFEENQNPLIVNHWKILWNA